MTTYRKRVTSVFLIIIAIFCFSTVVFRLTKTGICNRLIFSKDLYAGKVISMPLINSFANRTSPKIYLQKKRIFSGIYGVEARLLFSEKKNAPHSSHISLASLLCLKSRKTTITLILKMLLTVRKFFQNSVLITPSRTL